MKNIFNDIWDSSDTLPVINSDGDILGCIGNDEDHRNYSPVMIDRAAKLIWEEMTTDPDAYMIDLDVEE